VTLNNQFDQVSDAVTIGLQLKHDFINVTSIGGFQNSPAGIGQ
jgi:hypothetical protein